MRPSAKYKRPLMIGSVVTVVSSILFNINDGVLLLEEMLRSYSGLLILQMRDLGHGKK